MIAMKISDIKAKDHKTVNAEECDTKALLQSAFNDSLPLLTLVSLTNVAFGVVDDGKMLNDIISVINLKVHIHVLKFKVVPVIMYFMQHILHSTLSISICMCNEIVPLLWTLLSYSCICLKASYTCTLV